jgi:hypothetical protein
MTEHASIDRRRFVQGAGAVAGAAALTTVLPAPRAHAALPPGASAFAPLAAPVRVVDTRPATFVGGYQSLDERRIRIPLRGQYGVPGSATAVVATLTGVNYGIGNWVAAFPSGADIPVVSNLNLVEPGLEANANLVTVKIGPDGAVDLASRVPCDVIFDLLGYYEPIDGAVAAGRFIGLDEARRVLDTRPDHGGSGAVGPESTTVVDLSSVIPPDASAAVINLTATQTWAPGYCTVYPYALADRPPSSSLNWNGPDATRAAAVIAQVDNQDGLRRIKVFSKAGTHLIVDVTGYYTSDTSGLSQIGAFVPLDPVRILDTRAPEQMDPQTPGGVLWPKWVREVKIPGEAATRAASVLVNLTGTQSRGPGFLTIAPARHPLPGTSNLNFTKAWATVPNHAITRITHDHGLQVYTSHGAAMIVDLGGYFVGSPASPLLAPAGNPPPPPIGVPWLLTVPGLTQIWVHDGDADAVTNAGLGWHWTGTGNVGEAANIGIFAHRSEAGGPFFHIQYLEPGHEWYLDTTDGRRYVYVMTRRDLTDAANQNILDATRFEPAPSCSLIACTVGYDSTKTNYPDAWAPTSTKYRIIVTGRLDRWYAIT